MPAQIQRRTYTLEDKERYVLQYENIDKAHKREWLKANGLWMGAIGKWKRELERKRKSPPRKRPHPVEIKRNQKIASSKVTLQEAIYIIEQRILAEQHILEELKRLSSIREVEA